MPKKLLFTLAAAATLGTAVPAFAQRGGHQEARQKVESMVINELVTQLNLDGDTATRFREVAARYQLQLAAIHKDMHQAHEALKQLTEATSPNAATLSQLSDQIVADRDKLQTLESQRTAENRKILTPLQFARLLVVWPELSQRVRKQANPDGPQLFSPKF